MRLMPSFNYWRRISIHGEISRTFYILKTAQRILGPGRLIGLNTEARTVHIQLLGEAAFANTLSPRLATLAQPNTATRRQWDTRF